MSLMFFSSQKTSVESDIFIKILLGYKNSKKTKTIILFDRL